MTATTIFDVAAVVTIAVVVRLVAPAASSFASFRKFLAFSCRNASMHERAEEFAILTALLAHRLAADTEREAAVAGC